MLQLNQSSIYQIALHAVGNKGKDEPLIISKGLLDLNSEIKTLLASYFLLPFKKALFSTFTHSSDIALNEVYAYASKIFADPDSLYLHSISVAKHLFEQSTHPNIKPGELYVAYFVGCVAENEEVDAIGIFKSENKDTFLKVLQSNNNFEIGADTGVNINKLDKGCLIFNTEKEKGYKICVIDQTNKSEEAHYWKDDFLQIMPRNDSYHYTENYMELCKNFVTDKLPNEFEISKTDQIDFLKSASKKK